MGAKSSTAVEAIPKQVSHAVDPASPDRHSLGFCATNSLGSADSREGLEAGHGAVFYSSDCSASVPVGGSNPGKGSKGGSLTRRVNNTEGQFSSEASDYELADAAGGSRPMPPVLKEWFNKQNSTTLQASLAFVPWILQESILEPDFATTDKIIVHRGFGAVVSSDASGFSILTESLASKSNGAELLQRCLAAFFTPLIDLIDAYRGDVVKFSGDGLLIYFPAVDDTRLHDPAVTGFMIPPHGSYDQPDIGPLATAVLRASACCIEIHKRRHMFDTGVDGVRMSLRCGIGFGEVAILSLGGVQPPQTNVSCCEYLMCGAPLEQISIAASLAKTGETCLSPQAWEHVRECVVEGSPLEDRPDYHLLLRLEETKFTFPTIKYSAMETDTREQHKCRLAELEIIRRYVPSQVFKQIQCGTLQYINEMREITTTFISGQGVDISTDSGAIIAQELMWAIQTTCYGHEGTLNKVLIGDRGMVFLLVHGLPPLVHTDEPTRAVLAALDIVTIFNRMKLHGKLGITSGRAYCGTCGSPRRMEYSVLGDNVNLAMRLMSNAPPQGVLCDERTQRLCTAEVSFRPLPPIAVKCGNQVEVHVFQPYATPPPQFVGLGSNGRIFFPWYGSPFGGMTLDLRPLTPDGHERGMSYQEVMKNNVAQICSLSNWSGISKVQDILGAKFSPEIHKRESVVTRYPPPLDIPPGSPFEIGGVIVLEGKTGDGKIELADHIITYTAVKLGILPIFGSMGPRIGDPERLGVELLRSTMGVFRHLNPKLPSDDFQCLVNVLPSDYTSSLPMFHEAMSPQGERQHSAEELLQALLDLLLVLLAILRKQTYILVVLQLEVGTNLFPKTLMHFQGFWDVVEKLYAAASPEEEQDPQAKPLTLLVVSKVADRKRKAVRAAKKSGCHVRTTGLDEDDCREYISKYLNVPEEILPLEWCQFIGKTAMGNLLYIRETIDQLLLHGHVKVLFGNSGPESLQWLGANGLQDLESINVASWDHTEMVGETCCLLESLDPLEAAVVKICTVFNGTFTLSDLASSSCSRWAGASMFDRMRLFLAVNKLVERGILEVVEDQAEFDMRATFCSGDARSDQSYTAAIPVYTLASVLIRKVGGSMLLEAQRRAVKRQALIDRVLSRDLPSRMWEVMLKKKEQHVPWYYENILSRPI